DDQLARQARARETGERAFGGREPTADRERERRDAEDRDLVTLPPGAQDLDVQDERAEPGHDDERKEEDRERHVGQRAAEQEAQERLGEQGERDREGDAHADSDRPPVASEPACAPSLVRVSAAVQAPAQSLRRQERRVRGPEQRAVDAGERERAEEAHGKHVGLPLEDDGKRRERERKLRAGEAVQSRDAALW